MAASWTTRARLIVAALLILAPVVHAQGDELLVTNVQVQQRGFTALFDATYDLETVGDVAATVSMFLSTDGGASFPYLCRSVSGDVGSNVLPGASRHIVWNAGADFPSFSGATCQLRLTADDSGNLNEFIYIDPGCFLMGSPANEPGRFPNETEHQVVLTHGIYMQVSEVTNQQYLELAQWACDHGYATATGGSLRDNLDGSMQELLDLDGQCEISFNGSTFSVDEGKGHHPVLDVTWYGAVAYCDWLSLQQELTRAYDHGTWQSNAGEPYTASGYRLPTEAEWEYACRAGSTTAFANGPITRIYCSPVDPNLGLVGWYCGNAGGWTHPVAQKLSNAWGLYDMHGNLLEWCNDWYAAVGGAVTDPVGPGTGSYRVLRGGPWDGYAQYSRSAFRNYDYPYYSNRDVGFRPVRSAN